MAEASSITDPPAVSWQQEETSYDSGAFYAQDGGYAPVFSKHNPTPGAWRVQGEGGGGTRRGGLLARGWMGAAAAGAQFDPCRDNRHRPHRLHPRAAKQLPLPEARGGLHARDAGRRRPAVGSVRLPALPPASSLQRPSKQPAGANAAPTAPPLQSGAPCTRPARIRPRRTGRRRTRRACRTVWGRRAALLLPLPRARCTPPPRSVPPPVRSVVASTAIPSRLQATWPPATSSRTCPPSSCWWPATWCVSACVRAGGGAAAKGLAESWEPDALSRRHA
jgi:hypothetical protein